VADRLNGPAFAGDAEARRVVGAANALLGRDDRPAAGLPGDDAAAPT
jgi:hypothetical protein